MKIPVFLPKSHLNRSYVLAKQCVGKLNSLHGKIVWPWRIYICIYKKLRLLFKVARV